MACHMTRLADHWPAFILLALYFGLLIRHAIIGQRQTKQLADYYVGGRNMGGVVIGLSFFATFASTNSYVGNAGQAYALGASWLLLTVGFIFFAIISWILVAPRLRHFTASLNSITVPDFLGFRYSSGPVRVLAAVIVIFASLLYMTAIFKGIGNALQTYLDISYRTAVILVLGMERNKTHRHRYRYHCCRLYEARRRAAHVVALLCSSRSEGRAPSYVDFYVGHSLRLFVVDAHWALCPTSLSTRQFGSGFSGADSH